MDKRRLTSKGQWDQVVSQGFDIPEEGEDFYHGQAMPMNDESPDSLEDQDEYTFLLCKVAVGKAQRMTESTSILGKQPGFDSILIGNDDDSEFKYRYRVFNKNQVIPSAIVKFKLSFKDQLRG